MPAAEVSGAVVSAAVTEGTKAAVTVGAEARKAAVGAAAGTAKESLAGFGKAAAEAGANAATRGEGAAILNLNAYVNTAPEQGLGIIAQGGLRPPGGDSGPGPGTGGEMPTTPDQMQEAFVNAAPVTEPGKSELPNIPTPDQQAATDALLDKINAKTLTPADAGNQINALRNGTATEQNQTSQTPDLSHAPQRAYSEDEKPATPAGDSQYSERAYDATSGEPQSTEPQADTATVAQPTVHQSENQPLPSPDAATTHLPDAATARMPDAATAPLPDAATARIPDTATVRIPRAQEQIPGSVTVRTPDVKAQTPDTATVKTPDAPTTPVENKPENKAESEQNAENGEKPKSMQERRDDLVAKMARLNPNFEPSQFQEQLNDALNDPDKMALLEQTVQALTPDAETVAAKALEFNISEKLAGNIESAGELQKLLSYVQEQMKQGEGKTSEEAKKWHEKLKWWQKALLALALIMVAIPVGVGALGLSAASKSFEQK